MNAAALLLPLLLAAEEFPAGLSTPVLEGLKTWVVVPQGASKETPASLVIVLHGAGGTADGMAGTFAAWEDGNYVVCAPKSTGQTWTPADLQAVLRIGARLKAALPIDPKRVHVVGFSNGGWNLSPLAFDDALRPLTATWVAAGYNGGSVPKWAKTGLSVLALAGSADGNADAARKTVPALREKVRRAEVRLQPGLGHSWPDQHNEYLRWWMGAAEGRFVPGEDRNFEWGEDLAAALGTLKGKKAGGVLVYLHDDSEISRAIQNDIFQDPLVRHYGSRLACVKLPRAGGPFDAAVAVLKRDGKPHTLFTDKVTARSLAAALRAVSPDKSPPDE